MSKSKHSAEKYAHLLKSDVFDQQLYSYLIHYLYKSGFMSVGITLTVLLSFYLLLADQPGLNVLNFKLWCSSVLIVSAIRLINTIDYFRTPLIREQSKTRELYFSVTSFLHGVCWLYFLFFVLNGSLIDYNHYYLIIIILSGMLVGSVNTLAPSKMGFFLYAFPMFLGLTYNFMFVQQLMYMSVVLAILFVFLTSLYINSHLILKENLTARLLNEIMLKELEKHNSSLVNEIIEKSKQAHLNWEMAHKDSLTGLDNRRSLEVQLTMLQNKVEHSNKNAMLFIDLDDFKVINDTLGHDVGDKVLVEMSNRLKHNVKQHDLVVRQGGDEFIVLLKGVKHIEHLNNILSRLSRKLNETYVIESFTFNITVSIGVYWFDLFDKESIEAITKKADKALYRVKETGKQSYLIYNEEDFLNDTNH